MKPTHKTKLFEFPIHIDQHGQMWEQSAIKANRGKWIPVDEPTLSGWDAEIVPIAWTQLELF